MARCCNDFSRTDLLRRAAAEAGRGLPAIESGMPLPAGTGLDRRTFLARTAGLALAVYGGSSLLPRALEDGIAAATAAGPQKVLVSVFLDGGADSLSMLFPDGDPLYRKLRPRLALPASTGLPFSEDARLRWHPSLAGLAQLHAEGKVAVMAGVGYTGPDQSHFTSRHFWEVGATSEQLRTGWLGRYLDRSGSPDNPLQGLSLDWRLQPALATAKMPVASIDGPDQYGFWTRNVWGDVEKRMLDAIGALGRLPTNGDAALREATSAARQSARLRQQLLPFTPKNDQPGFTSPVAYPKGDDEFPRRLAGLAAMLGAGLPVRVVALSAPGMYDTHDDQPQELADGPEADRRQPAGVPARPRGARSRRPRGRPRLVGVRAAREGERLERDRSRRRRRGLPDRLARERDDDRRVSRPREARRAREPACHIGLPRRSTARCSSSGSAPTRRRSSQARASSPGRK